MAAPRTTSRSPPGRTGTTASSSPLFELRKDCDTVIVGGLSTGRAGAAAGRRNPEHVHGIALLAPTFWLNGWHVPWYVRLFSCVCDKRLANLIQLSR